MVTASIIVVIISTIWGSCLAVNQHIMKPGRTTTQMRHHPVTQHSSTYQFHRIARIRYRPSTRPRLTYHFRHHHQPLPQLHFLTYLSTTSFRNTTNPSRTTRRSPTTRRPKSRPKAKVQCGIDNSPYNNGREGPANIEYYPWLGVLLYPYDSPRRSLTTVILVSQQAAITSALEIDYYPKDDFRSRSRVILGHNCSSPSYIRVIDYTFHPDFVRSTYSTLALVQLDTKPFHIHVFPICAPSKDFDNPEDIYAMSLPQIPTDCYNSTMVHVYKMVFVDMKECRKFYTKADLNLASMWPTHMACGRGLHGGHCVWRGGTALVIREGSQWKLVGMATYGPGCNSPTWIIDYSMYHQWLGVGIYGPGCQSPARFIDYGMNQQWVEQVQHNTGRPAITRLDPSSLVLRRTVGNIQRFGPCTAEETKMEIFSDSYPLVPELSVDSVSGYQKIKVTYNMTLLKNVDYHCIILRVTNYHLKIPLPEISSQRYCSSQLSCYDYMNDNIYYYVEIKCMYPCEFSISAYGVDTTYFEAMKLLASGIKIRSYPYKN